MTVKVIKGPKKYTVKKTCGGCKAELQATEDDMKVGQFGANYGGDSPDPGIYFECPVCDSDVRVPDAPDSLMERIERRDTKDKR